MAAIILGVDPGLSGALAFYGLGLDTFEIVDMPVIRVKKGKTLAGQLDLLAIARLLDMKSVLGGVFHAYVERVSASPQMGVVSAFNFGRGYGSIEGLLAAHFIPMTLVTPVEWKRTLKCPSDKEGARLRAGQLLPNHAHLWERKKDDGRAEAAMIAYFGGRNHE